MKKLTVDLPKTSWGTIKTKYAKNSPIVDAAEFTGASKNFDTWRKGSITKRLGGDYFNPTPFTNVVQDVYEAVFADGSRNLLAVDGNIIKYSTGTTTFSTLLSGVTPGANWEFSMYQDRVYGGNATNNPIVYDKSKTTKVKDMGCQVPTIGSCAATAGSAVANTVPDGTYTYKITYLYYGSEESNGSGATASVTITGGPKQINLTGIPVGPNDHVTARKIYRDDGTTGYLYIDTINDNTTTTYTDGVPAGTSDIPVDNYAPTNFGLIITYLDRLWTAEVTGQPSYVRYSEAGLPDIFLSTNYLLCNPVDPIIAIVEYNDRIIVFNRNSMGQIIGRTKDSFQYSSISDTVGCADKRSIRVRTVDGIPTLVWLSTRGLYLYNGSAVTYISDPIEDLLNVNVQQATNTKGKNSQVPSYSLTNPSKVWNDNAEWDDGSTTLANISQLLDNYLRVPTRYAPTNSDGTYLGAASANGPTNSWLGGPVSDFTGESMSSTNYGYAAHEARAVAYPIVPNRTFNLSSFTIPLSGPSAEFGWYQSPTSFWHTNLTTQAYYEMQIRSDNFGSPSNTVLYTTGVLPWTATATTQYHQAGVSSPPPPAEIICTPHTFSASPNYTMYSGTRYWVMVWCSLQSGGSVWWPGNMQADRFPNTYGGVAPTGVYYGSNAGAFLNIPISGSSGSTGHPSYTCVTAPVSQSGQWISNVYDSKSDNLSTSVYLDQSATLPSGAAVVTTIETSDNFSGPFSSDANSTVSNLNGSQAFTLTVAKRFWRIRQALSIADDRNYLLAGSPTLRFATQGVWTSAVIDASIDISALNALTAVSTIPSGTSIVLEIRTSPDSFTWSSYSAIGSATPQRYLQVRVTMNAKTDDSDTPILQALQLDWTKTLTVTGSAIDTGAAPVGWDTFVASYALNGGTVTFYVRSATALIGLSSASWTSILSGAFIGEPLNQFVQWKAVLVATAGNVPTFSAADVNWYTSLSTAIRASSIFINRSYYLSVAEYNQTTNNLVIALDPEGKFRVYRDLHISAFVNAFNEAYAMDATNKKLLKWLSNTTDQGTAIEMIVETKAYDFDAPRNDKVMRKFYLRARNTGARYYTYCSFDMGATWISMKDMHTGLSYIDTSLDLGLNISRWVPDFNAGVNMYGKTVSFKVVNNDTHEAEILGVESECWVRMGDII